MTMWHVIVLYLTLGLLGLIIPLYLCFMVFPNYKWFRKIIGGTWYYTYTKNIDSEGNLEVSYYWTKSYVPFKLIINVEKYEPEQD